jgi:hypothetical protein
VDRYRIEAVFLRREIEPGPSVVSVLQRLAAGGVEVRVDEPWSAAMLGAAASDRGSGGWVRLAVPPLLGRGSAAKSVLDFAGALVLAVVSLPGFLVFSTIGAGFGVRPRPVTLPGAPTIWKELVARGDRPLPGWVQLPRFLQVLRGRLSLVGPNGSGAAADSGRPRPGLAVPTMAGQVLDGAAYCERWSLALDLECLLRQPGALLGSGRVELAPAGPDRPGED